MSQERGALQIFKATVLEILKSPKELFLVYSVNLLLTFNYNTLTFMIPLYYTQEQKVSDTQAGLVFGSLGVLIGVLAIVLGPVINILSCKKGILMSSISGAVGFGLLGHTRDFGVSLVAVVLFHSVSISMAWSVIELGVKMFTPPEARNTSNSFLLVVNYLSGILAGFFIDYVWSNYENKEHIYRNIYYTSCASACLAMILALFLNESQAFESTKPESYGLNRKVFVKKRFWRFAGLILLLTLLRSGCFGHLDATFPKFMVRVFGDDAHFGYLIAVHSTSMMLGTLGFTPLSYITSSYNLILVGGFLGALAPTVLAFEPTYATCVVFVVLISFGESIWVPRLLDYTFEVAPRGEEGTYLALNNSPNYFGMILTGLFSGNLLESFCPPEGEKQCYLIWIVIGIATFTISIVICLLKPFIIQPKHEEEEFLPCFKDSQPIIDGKPCN